MSLYESYRPDKQDIESQQEDHVYMFDMDDPNNVVTLAKVITAVRRAIDQVGDNTDKLITLYFVRGTNNIINIDFYFLKEYLISVTDREQFNIVFRGRMPESEIKVLKDDHVQFNVITL